MKRSSHGGPRNGAGRPPRPPISGMSLRLRRVAAGLTADQLAARSGCARATLTTWERETARPDAEALGRLAIALGCRVADLRRAPKVR